MIPRPIAIKNTYLGKKAERIVACIIKNSRHNMEIFKTSLGVSLKSLSVFGLTILFLFDCFIFSLLCSFANF